MGAVVLLWFVSSLGKRTVSADVASFKEKTPAANRWMSVNVKVTGVDLNREMLTLQLECIPQGDELLGLTTGKLLHPATLTLGISPEGTTRKVVFKGENTGGILNVALDLDGNVNDYPWDRHVTSLWLTATMKVDGSTVPVPVRLSVYGMWPGMDIKADARNAALGPVVPRELDFVVTRSTVTVMVVYFSIALTWILIFSVVGMVVSVMFSGRKPEVSMLAYFGTLLFAMTAFRNALPGTPPMGTASDYVAFFWGYAVAIVAIAAVSIAWLTRQTAKAVPPGDQPPPTTTEESGYVPQEEVAPESVASLRTDAG
jgi:hypothetical protein